jgi:hypothetical protein
MKQDIYFINRRTVYEELTSKILDLPTEWQHFFFDSIAYRFRKILVLK